jgi:hypothetical protein
MNFFYCIQCKDKISSHNGCFVFEENKKFEAISPVFSDVFNLFLWMKNKYVTNEWDGDKYIPFRIKKI